MSILEFQHMAATISAVPDSLITLSQLYDLFGMLRVCKIVPVPKFSVRKAFSTLAGLLCSEWESYPVTSMLQ